MILARYLTRMFLVRFLGALAGFAALVEVLDLFDTAGEMLERGEGLGGLANYALLRLPVILVDVTPFAVLVAAVFTFMPLAAKSETTAMRALGVSARRIIMFLAPVALAVGVLHLAAANLVAPKAESALRDWLLRTAGPEETPDEARAWVRSGPILVGFAAGSPDGAHLEQIWIYERDAQGRIARRIVAESAEYASPLWRLRNTVTDLPDGTRQRNSEIAFDLRLEPGDVLELSYPREHLSFRRLREATGEGPTGARSQEFYRTRMLAMGTLLVIPAIMLLLAAPTAFAHMRRRGVGVQAGLSLGWGLSFILVAGILRTLGEAGAMAPVLAVWTAPVIFMLAAASRLTDTGR